MALGILNPGDNPASTVTRPVHTNTGANVRKWWSDDDEGTLLMPQDLNALIAQLRELGDFYGITDIEGDDTYTRRAIQSAMGGYVAWNFVENASFEVMQRPTPWLLLGSATTRIFDRWIARRATVANATCSRRVGFNGSQYGLRLARDVSTTDLVRIDVGQQVPTHAAYAMAGKNVVLSFDARTGATYSGGGIQAAIVTGTGVAEFFNLITFPTGAVTTNFSGFSAIAPSTTTRIVSNPLVVPAGISELGFRIGWTPSGTAGATDHLEITNVQLEIGFAASTFTPRLPAVEDAVCRWYFERVGADSSITQFGYGLARSGTIAYIPHVFAPKRDIPTITINGPTNFSVMRLGNTTIDTTALAAAYMDRKSCRLDATVASGLTSGEAVGLQGKTTASYIDISAEL